MEEEENQGKKRKRYYRSPQGKGVGRDTEEGQGERMRRLGA